MINISRLQKILASSAGDKRLWSKWHINTSSSLPPHLLVFSSAHLLTSSPPHLLSTLLIPSGETRRLTPEHADLSGSSAQFARIRGVQAVFVCPSLYSCVTVWISEYYEIGMITVAWWGRWIQWGVCNGLWANTRRDIYLQITVMLMVLHILLHKRYRHPSLPWRHRTSKVKIWTSKVKIFTWKFWWHQGCTKNVLIILWWIKLKYKGEEKKKWRKKKEKE